jgi:predicted metal-dependent HD superfamily phosphohydrolase
MRANLQSWQALWRRIGASNDGTAPFHRMVAAYAEPFRHYHTLQHIDECLTTLDEVGDVAQDRDHIETALWLHDVVYNPRSSTNEEDSAELAGEWLAEGGVDARRIARIRTLILSTKSHEPGDLADAALLIDIDLAVLGQAPARFCSYEAAIRAEYAWAPEPQFAQARAHILRRFLERPRIYRTEPLHSRYETAARANLAASIARLSLIVT